jgi:hypothetical protein
MSKGPPFTDKDKAVARAMPSATAAEIAQAIGRQVDSVRAMLAKESIPYRKLVPIPGGRAGAKRRPPEQRTVKGNPCRLGHPGLRYVGSGACVDCAILRQQRLVKERQTEERRSHHRPRTGPFHHQPSDKPRGAIPSPTAGAAFPAPLAKLMGSR